MRKIALVGSPNVGKSLLFNKLTGGMATVSNYPGTTVETTQAITWWGRIRTIVIDTPGLYSLNPISEEEQVTLDLLQSVSLDWVVNVVDGKNLERLLPTTLQLIKAGLPVVLVVNMMDEVRQLGIEIDFEKLRQRLGIPVFPTVSTEDLGVKKLLHFLTYSKSKAASLTRDHHQLTLGDYQDLFTQSRTICQQTVKTTKRTSPYTFFDRILLSQLTGVPIALFLLYFALYQLVGRFGAGYLVDIVDGVLFQRIINPFWEHWFSIIVPEPIFPLLAGEYGIFTLALRYAIAIILPIVGLFFLVFALLEDSGYLPRLALLLDRTLKHLGLNGRGVIPLILGLGCGTMATVVTRTLETRRERKIATFLLALAVPCSAQLGLFLALLANNPQALVIWLVTVSTIFLWVGSLLAVLLPGEAPLFYGELPPLRIPLLRNAFTKTRARMYWYFKEVLPVFVGASVLIWLGQITGIFPRLLTAFELPLETLGLPATLAPVFLFGFFRRDYGAAGLYHLQSQLSWEQLAITAITLTLFVPCVAQLSVMLKERGVIFTGLALVAITLVAYLTGLIVSILI